VRTEGASRLREHLIVVSSYIDLTDVSTDRAGIDAAMLDSGTATPDDIPNEIELLRTCEQIADLSTPSFS